ncbi:hypothetical protein Sjap_019753 [Stephania japonica]|uniref:S-protein homolog n=1 Tax=Stephania japonica TaxID=461633 RepID=A0AAP0F021_9MAGN
MERYLRQRLSFAFVTFLFILVLQCMHVEPIRIINIKRHVHVWNDVSSTVKLNLHCKSGDDDLGQQVLAYQQEFTWSFRGNIFARTLFWCAMNWANSTGHVFQQSFVVYESKVTPCGKNCVWSARMDGVYFLDSFTGAYVLKYNWQ